jgi:hypothetical protein
MSLTNDVSCRYVAIESIHPSIHPSIHLPIQAEKAALDAQRKALADKERELAEKGYVLLILCPAAGVLILVSPVNGAYLLSVMWF